MSTLTEVNQYGGVGTENNHVNKYTQNSVGTAFNREGYGGMTYYSSETCGKVNDSIVTTNCTSDYNYSDIKYVVDAWENDIFVNNELKIVNNYKARLITVEEFISIPSTYIWKYTTQQLYYWTMTPVSAYSGGVIEILENRTYPGQYYYADVFVRPVINVYKTAIQS